MLVTLPLVLLLLDYWPLGRFSGPAGRAGFRPVLRLVVEKLPLLAVAAAAAAVSFWAQGEARVSNEVLPLAAGESVTPWCLYVQYLGRLVYPSDLAVLYPRPMEGSDIGDQAWLAAAFLGTITAAAVVWRRAHPVRAGWLVMVPRDALSGQRRAAVRVRRNGPPTVSRTCPRSDWRWPKLGLPATSTPRGRDGDGPAGPVWRCCLRPPFPEPGAKRSIGAIAKRCGAGRSLAPPERLGTLQPGPGPGGAGRPGRRGCRIPPARSTSAITSPRSTTSWGWPWNAKAAVRRRSPHSSGR